jgi:transposase-like protein
VNRGAVMKWRKDKHRTECPQCESNNSMFIFNKLLSKPRTEYKCDDCGCEWHYSKQMTVQVH